MKKHQPKAKSPRKKQAKKKNNKKKRLECDGFGKTKKVEAGTIFMISGVGR